MKGEYIFRSGSWECEIWEQDIYLIDYRYDFCFVIPNKVKELHEKTMQTITNGNYQSQFEKHTKDFLKSYFKGKKVRI